jgi:hypothetical protein
MTSEERRTAPRVQAPCTVKYFYLPPSPNPPDTHVINLSSCGACLEVPDPLIRGSVVAFQIITPDYKVVDACARVIHVQPGHHPYYLAGVYFTRLSENDRALLQHEVQRAASPKPPAEENHAPSTHSLERKTRRVQVQGSQ